MALAPAYQTSAAQFLGLQAHWLIIPALHARRARIRVWGRQQPYQVLI
jgi:hypothetical protein